jgi:G:T-mismatch repair DNA endonuclease (very short patch repair protein)
MRKGSKASKPAWNKGEVEQYRIDLFAEFGYKTLIIWERELKNKDILIEKLKLFCDVPNEI